MKVKAIMGGKPKTSTRSDRRLGTNKNLPPYDNPFTTVKNSRKVKEEIPVKKPSSADIQKARGEDIWVPITKNIGTLLR